MFLACFIPLCYDLHVHVKLDRSDNTAVGSCEGDIVSWRNHEKTIHDLVTKASATGQVGSCATSTICELVRYQTDISFTPKSSKKRKHAEEQDAEDETDLTVWVELFLTLNMP